ncbi:MAG: rubredoxin-like domain-containing protein [Candidatus Scalindua sp.]
MKKWKCSVCDYVHEGDTPPVECPHCESIVEVFSEQIDKNKKEIRKWAEIRQHSRLDYEYCPI